MADTFRIMDFGLLDNAIARNLDVLKAKWGRVSDNVLTVAWVVQPDMEARRAAAARLHDPQRR